MYTWIVEVKYLYLGNGKVNVFVVNADNKEAAQEAIHTRYFPDNCLLSDVNDYEYRVTQILGVKYIYSYEFGFKKD